MGSFIPMRSNNGDALDLIHSLSQKQRRERLLDGYIASILTLNSAIPKDVKSVLNIYLNGMDAIKSKTEIKEEIRRRDLMWMGLPSP